MVKPCPAVPVDLLGWPGCSDLVGMMRDGRFMAVVAALPLCAAVDTGGPWQAAPLYTGGGGSIVGSIRIFEPDYRVW